MHTSDNIIYIRWFRRRRHAIPRWARADSMATADFFSTYNQDQFRGGHEHMQASRTHKHAERPGIYSLARRQCVSMCNGCRYHLVFTAGRRKGDGMLGAPAPCAGRPAASFLFFVLPLGSCFSTFFFYLLSFASPAQRTLLLIRTHMPFGSIPFFLNIALTFRPLLLPLILNRHKKSDGL